jgi:hypothetical protein
LSTRRELGSDVASLVALPLQSPVPEGLFESVSGVSGSPIPLFRWLDFFRWIERERESPS